MSWKYASSYTPRDHSSSRDSSQIKFGYSSNKYSTTPTERQSRWSSSVSDPKFYRNSSESVEHSPIWAKTCISDNPASVQRLKERYNISDEPKRDIKPIKKAETKDLPSPTSGKPYGRSLTTGLSLSDNKDGSSISRFRRRPDRTPEPEKNTHETKPSLNLNSYDSKVLYMPTATTKLLSRKYSNDLSPTMVNAISKSFPKVEKNEDEDTVTMVTRGTSPTPNTSCVYLRSKRSDFYGLEKKVPKPRRKPEMVNKEVQTDREEVSLSKYSKYTDSNVRSKPWTSYGSSYTPKFSTRSGYTPDSRSSHIGLAPSDCRRSTSREESDDPTTPDSPHKSLTMKPPTLSKTPPTSPVKEPDKKTLVRKSPPAGIRSSLKLDVAKTELAKTPNSPTHVSSPLQCKIIMTENLQSPNKPSSVQSPKVTINCPDISQTIDDVSSMSESSEEETSSDEEPASADSVMTVKKSVTNFLQNIPTALPQNPSRPNLYQKLNSLSPQKINFKRIESGEKAWWLDNPEKVPEGVERIKSTWSVPKSDHDGQELKSPSNNFLQPPNIINRQFSRDKDWLRGSSEDVSKAVDAQQPWQNEVNGDVCVQRGVNGLPNGDYSHFIYENALCDENGDGSFDVTPALRRRDQFSKSPDNFLAEDTNHQMKFNQPAVDDRKYLADFPRECSIKDLGQKIQNGLGSPLEDKNFLEPGDMSGLISKAKAGLAHSKTKLDIKKSSSREMSPKVADTKSEIDLYWKELADSMNRPLRLCDLDFTDLNSDDETDFLGNFKANGEVPPPPPMLILPVPMLTPIKNINVPTPPANINLQPVRNARAPASPPVHQIVKNKKTVKLFWKEVKDEPVIQQKVPGGPLIWDELSKVKIDTQKLEYLFESRAKDLMSKKQQDQNKNKEIIVLDPKRSNAINIGMTKLPPPRAIKTAILKMDSTVVNKEGIEKLLTMLPTEEEKLRIQEAQSANPDVPLGSAEQFLLTLASINELEARLRLWAFKLDFENSEKEICEPLMDLKQGMEILRVNKTFRGILSTLLSIGNFLNGYDVKGFQIEYLSKVPEVKDTVHKHSLLHHLCIIVMDKFPDSTDLYSEIGAVTRASKVDFDELAANIKKVEDDCKLSWNYLKMIAKHEGHTAMKVKMSDFLADCAERIIVLGTVHKRIINKFQKFLFWFGVPVNRISTTRPNEIFKIISEFALEYRTTRDRVLQQIKKMNREKSRTRGYLTNDTNDMVLRKMTSKEAKDDARLKQLLENDSGYSENMINGSTWRRQRKDTKNLLQEVNNDDVEILDALIKTANQIPSSRGGLKERRRSRVYGKYCEYQ